MAKRFVTAIMTIGVVLVSLIAFAPPARADYNMTDVQLADAGVTVPLPKDNMTVTRDKVINQNQELLTKVNMTPEAIQKMLTEQSAYADSMFPDGTSEIMVIKTDATDKVGSKDLADTSNSDIESLTQSITDGLKSTGYQVTHTSTTQPENIRWIYIGAQKTGGGDWYYQCFTIVAGKTYSITLHNYAAEVTNDQELLAEYIAAYTKFDARPNNNTENQGILRSVFGSLLVAGIVGAVVLVAIIAVVVLLVMRSRKKKAQRATQVFDGRPDPQ